MLYCLGMWDLRFPRWWTYQLRSSGLQMVANVTEDVSNRLRTQGIITQKNSIANTVNDLGNDMAHCIFLITFRGVRVLSASVCLSVFAPVKCASCHHIVFFVYIYLTAETLLPTGLFIDKQSSLFIDKCKESTCLVITFSVLHKSAKHNRFSFDEQRTNAEMSQ